MKKKLKKFFIVLLVLLLIGGAATGGVYAYQSYQKENAQAQVFYVSNLNYGYSSDAMTSAGYVTNDYEQSVYLEDKSVVEVKVEEGAKVKIGDPLLVLDTTEEQLQIDMKNLELQKVENDIKIAEKDITELKKKIPGSSTTTNNQSQGNGTSGTDGTSGSGTNGSSGSGTSGSATNGSSGSGSGTNGTSGSGTNSSKAAKGSRLSSSSAKGSSAISSSDDFYLANAKGASTTTTAAGSSVIIMEVEQRDGDAYNYIDKNAEPYEGKGTPEKPYRFLCTQECYVLGSYLNQLVKNEQVAAFEIWSGNSVDEGTLLSCWTVNGAERSTVAEDSKWKVATQQQITTEVAADDEDDSDADDDDDDSDNSGSSNNSGSGSSNSNGSGSNSSQDDDDDTDDDGKTIDELKKDLAEKESDLKELQIDKKTAELELEKLQKAKDQATILATINGVVTTIGDIENPPTDGSAFMEISGAEGLYVKGEISELLLDQIEVGQEISANSWSDGQTYPAKITEISEYPSDNSGGYYGEGNPNVSYYSFTAYMEESTGLSNGDYVDLSIMPVDSEEGTNSLYIEKAYVRTENGKSYVLKAGEDDRLVKQYVQTGKTIYGSAIEIKAGLKDDDRIAFPYGKTAKEGVKAVDSDED